MNFSIAHYFTSGITLQYSFLYCTHACFLHLNILLCIFRNLICCFELFCITVHHCSILHIYSIVPYCSFIKSIQHCRIAYLSTLPGFPAGALLRGVPIPRVVTIASWPINYLLLLRHKKFVILPITPSQYIFSLACPT